MANYQNYTGNVQNNVENNQFNTDMNQNHVIMNAVNNLMSNHGANQIYSLPLGNYNFGQPLQNGYTQPYINGVNGGIIHNGNFFISPFPNADSYINGIPSYMPIQNFVQANIQADDNGINKNVHPRQQQSRKKNYGDQTKSIDSGDIEFDHKNRPLIYKCEECPRKFSMNSRLNTHMRCHNNERPHVCPQCSFAFTQKSYLVRHAAVHKEERPYQCHACKKTYKHYGSLANHRKTHKNGRNDMLSDNGAEEMVDRQKLEPENAVEDFQNNHYMFADQLKQESQNMSLATDLTPGYLEQLNAYPHNEIFLHNTDSTEVLTTSQSSSNPTSTFTV